ncbi:MAG TPA: hypothetical protein VF599_22035 [Pyrinomonadaceae bacterium]|jgi:hypothetical protein
MAFTVCIKKNPTGKWDENQNDRHMDFSFDDRDYLELRSLLNVEAPPVPEIKGEPLHEWDERIKNNYIAAAKKKGYEMLGRFWDWYDSAVYQPQEVNQLLDECLKLKQETWNRVQLTALDKLIATCREAIKTESGILFGSD